VGGRDGRLGGLGRRPASPVRVRWVGCSGDRAQGGWASGTRGVGGGGVGAIPRGNTVAGVGEEGKWVPRRGGCWGAGGGRFRFSRRSGAASWSGTRRVRPAGRAAPGRRGRWGGSGWVRGRGAGGPRAGWGRGRGVVTHNIWGEAGVRRYADPGGVPRGRVGYPVVHQWGGSRRPARRWGWGNGGPSSRRSRGAPRLGPGRGGGEGCATGCTAVGWRVECESPGACMSRGEGRRAPGKGSPWCGPSSPRGGNGPRPWRGAGWGLSRGGAACRYGGSGGGARGEDEVVDSGGVVGRRGGGDPPEPLAGRFRGVYGGAGLLGDAASVAGVVGPRSTRRCRGGGGRRRCLGWRWLYCPGAGRDSTRLGLG
jgi:hypothetical protein